MVYIANWRINYKTVMSSWLSGGFNQLTDQISSFTKEVLTETTEEITDPVAELEALRHKYSELLKSQEFLQSEHEKLKRHCDEQKDRADTAECQIASISQEYRKLLDNRDLEIRQLKTSNEALRNQKKEAEGASALRELARGQDQQPGEAGRDMAKGGIGESVDIGMDLEWVGLTQYGEEFAGSLDPQAELDHVRQEIGRLRAELQECRRQQKMEKEDHAHDLARLGVAHQNKVEVLTLQHQKQVGQLQDQLSVLQQEHEESQLQAHVEETSRIGNRETMELEEKTGESQVTGDVAQNTGMREQREQVQLQEAKRASLRAELAEARHAHQQDQVLLRQLQKDWTTAGQARATVEQERATVAQRLATVCDELDKERAKVTVLYQENSQLQFKVQAIEEELVKKLNVASSKTSDTIRQLEEKVATLTKERDDAMVLMSNAREQAEQNSQSMRNLQLALEHLEKDQKSELAEALKRSQLELSEHVEHCGCLKAQYEEACAELEEARAGAKAAALLSQELDDREALTAKLKEQVDGLKQELFSSQQASQDFQSCAVDSSLMKNLILGYVHATEAKKVEVLRVIAKILKFSEHELERACSVHSKGWLGGLWMGNNTSTSTENSESISQMFIHFLEKESSPKHAQATGSSTPSPSNYIDPLTDPDRPSLSTVSLLRPSAGVASPLEHPSHVHLPLQDQKSKSNTTPVSSLTSNNFQSSILKNVLS